MEKNDGIAMGRVSRTLFFFVAAMAVNYLISLLLTSYITENLGSEAYGFVSLAKTISNYAIIFTSCLNAYASRYITVAYRRNDKQLANTYYSSVFYANVALSVFVMLVAFVGSFCIDRLLNIPDNLLVEVRALLLLDFLNFMLLGIGTCFTVFAYISDRLDRLNQIKLISYVIEALVLILLFTCYAPSIVYVGWALVVSSVIFVGLSVIANGRYHPDLKLNRTFCRIKAVKELVLSGIWNSINSIGNLLQTGLDLVVSNLMLNAIAMGQLSIVKTLSTVFVAFYQLLAAPFQPRLLQYYSDGDKDGVVSTFNISIKISGLCSSLLFIGFVALGKMFYSLWTPSENASLLYVLTVLTFLGNMVEAMVYPLFYTYTLTLKNRIPCIVTVISGFLNVGGMYVLIRFFDMGLYAVVLTTTVLGMLICLVFTPLYAAKCLGCSSKAFYKTIFKVLIVSFAIAVPAFLFGLLDLSGSWAALVLYALITVALVSPIYFFAAFDKNERKSLLGRFVVTSVE